MSDLDSVLGITACGLSIVTTASVIGSITLNDSIRTFRHSLLRGAAISEFVFSLNGMWGIWATKADDIQCDITRVLNGTIKLSSVVMTFTIAHHTYYFLQKGVPLKRCVEWWKYYMLLLIFMSGTYGILAATIGGSRTSGYWCTATLTFNIVTFYTPVFILIGIGLVLTTLFYLGFKRKLREKNTGKTSEEIQEWISSCKLAINTTYAYQLLEVVVHFLPFFHRIYEFESNDISFTYWTHYFMLLRTLQGFLLGCVYWLMDSPKRNTRQHWSLKRVLGVEETYNMFMDFCQTNGYFVENVIVWKMINKLRHTETITRNELFDLKKYIDDFSGFSHSILRVSEDFRDKLKSIVDDNEYAKNFGESEDGVSNFDFLWKQENDLFEFMHQKIYWKFLDSEEFEEFRSSKRFPNEFHVLQEEAAHLNSGTNVRGAGELLSYNE